VGAGIAGGYLTSLRLRLVHWQPGEDRPLPASAVTIAGESALFVDPSEIPAAADVAKLGQALAYLDQAYELMANFADLLFVAVVRCHKRAGDPANQSLREG
jgi:hypothetical protein